MRVLIHSSYVLWTIFLLWFKANSLNQKPSVFFEPVPFSPPPKELPVRGQGHFETRSSLQISSEPSVLPHLWIETLVFADHTVRQRFATVDEAQLYVQTLMQITDNLLRHSSLGGNLSVVVRDIVWINATQSMELLWGSSLVRSVHRFCRWAMLHHYVRYDYDHAILLSRNIIKAAGISPLGQLCKIPYSCTLAEDSGFFSAYPIAHELMHSLGVEHDGEENECDQSGITGNIMAPVILSASHNHHWSDCTRQMLRTAMSTQRFDCLKDFPIEIGKFELDGPPGWHWTQDQQCQVFTGSTLSCHCPGVEDNVCQELWCSTTGEPHRCDQVMSYGLLDGTTCGSGQECYQGHCVTRKSSANRTGGCEQFSAWTPCSRNCGTGTQFKKTGCHSWMNTRMAKMNKRHVEYKLCQAEQFETCQSHDDFRAEQCIRFNRYKLRGLYHTWLPFVDYESPCQLKCMSMESGQVLSAGISVRDGTLCRYDNLDYRCVQSTCVLFDCEGTVNGKSQRDKCGKCGGDGTTCEEIRHLIERNLTSEDGDRVVYLLPRMARKLDVHLYSNNHNLGLFDMHQMKHLYFSDSVPKNSAFVRRVFFSTEFKIHHEFQDGVYKVNRITAPGPVVGDLAIKIHQFRPIPTQARLLLEVSYLISKVP